MMHFFCESRKSRGELLFDRGDADADPSAFDAMEVASAEPRLRHNMSVDACDGTGDGSGPSEPLRDDGVLAELWRRRKCSSS